MSMKTTTKLPVENTRDLKGKEVQGRTHPQDEHFLHQDKCGKSIKAFTRLNAGTLCDSF